MDSTPKKSLRRITKVSLLGLIGAVVGYTATQFFFKINPSPEPSNFSIIEKALLIIVIPITLFLVIAVHELGHLLTGLAQGFRFQMYIVGPFGIRRHEETDKIQVYLNRALNLAGGLAATTPVNNDPKNILRFARAVIAGPLISLLLGIMFIFISQHVTLFWKITYLIGGISSLAIFLITIIPYKTGTFLSDGKRFLRLAFGTDKEKQIESAILRITATYVGNKNYSMLDPKDITLLKEDDSSLMHTMGFFYGYLYYYTRGDMEKANEERVIFEEKSRYFPPGLQQFLNKEIERVKKKAEVL